MTKATTQPPTAPPIDWHPSEGAPVTLFFPTFDAAGNPVGTPRVRAKVVKVLGEDESIDLEIVNPEKSGLVRGSILTGVPRFKHGVQPPAYRPYLQPGQGRQDVTREDGDWEKRRAARLKAAGEAAK